MGTPLNTTILTSQLVSFWTLKITQAHFFPTQSYELCYKLWKTNVIFFILQPDYVSIQSSDSHFSESLKQKKLNWEQVELLHLIGIDFLLIQEQCNVKAENATKLLVKTDVYRNLTSNMWATSFPVCDTER